MAGETNSGWLTRMALAAVACGALALGACSAPVDEAEGQVSGDAITNVHPTPVKRQVIGNCWLYSITGWAESLHKAATGATLDLSESYLTYWYWFDQLAAPGRCGVSKIREGGNWELGRSLVERYGMMLEGDFIREDRSASASTRQADVLQDLNDALASEDSPLQRAVASGDRARIRAELSRLWRLAPEVDADLEAVFGADGTRTFDRDSDRDSHVPAASKVLAPGAIAARLPTVGSSEKPGTLADAVRSGAWMEVEPPSWQGDDAPESRRMYERRIQRALHDGFPVLVSWWVDVGSLDSRGRFTRPESGMGSGDGGGHMSIITDYEITNVPRFGTLRAGKLETRREALDAALAEEARISFFRIKNSWGVWPSTWKETASRLFNGVDLGYNDLHASYLFESLIVELDASMLLQDPDAPCDRTKAASDERFAAPLFPLLGVVLPLGY